MIKLIIVVPFLQLINLYACIQTRAKTVCFEPSVNICNASRCSYTQASQTYDDLAVPDPINITLTCEEDEDIHLKRWFNHYIPEFKSYNSCIKEENSQDYCNPFHGCSVGICCEKCCEELPVYSIGSGTPTSETCYGSECLVSLTRKKGEHYHSNRDFCKTKRTCYSHYAKIVYSCVKRKDSNVGFSVGVSIAMITVIAIAAAAIYLLVFRKKSAIDDNLQTPANREIQYAVSYSTSNVDNDDDALIENTDGQHI